MAWTISITPEGWDAIRDKCRATEARALAEALGDYNWEIFHGHPGNPHHKGAWNWEKLVNIPQDILADAVFECIESVYTCDPGDNRYWIDPEGYHGITLED